MTPYNPDRPLISIHTPKTAGTSLVNVLQLWYGSKLYRINQNNRDTVRAALSAPGFSGAGICIHGHFNASRGQAVDRQFPGIGQYITFLRDPLEHHISMYYFKKERVKSRNKVYWDWGTDNIPADINEFLTDHPSQLLHHMPSCFDRSNYVEILEQYYVFIGLVEEMDVSIQKLARLLNKRAVATAPHVNRSTRIEQPDTAAVAAFKAAAEFEYLVYNHARDIFRTL